MALRTSSSDEAGPAGETPRPDYRPGASGDGRPGLGVGQIVGESFSIFFRRIHWFALLAFVPQLIAGLLLIPMVGGLAGYAGLVAGSMERSEERRVGKGGVSKCRSRWSSNNYKKKNKRKKT